MRMQAEGQEMVFAVWADTEQKKFVWTMEHELMLLEKRKKKRMHLLEYVISDIWSIVVVQYPVVAG